MASFRISTRGLILAVAVIGFDAATMTRAIQQGRAVGSVREYVLGFGLVLLVLNLVLLAIGASFIRAAGGPIGQRWLAATPSPALIAGLYLAVLAFAILSVLFLSGRF
jgi:hypothetical protein